LVEQTLTTALAAKDVELFSAARHENDAALAWRLAAAAMLAELALPDRVQHLWKYTDPASLLPSQPLLTTAAPASWQVPELPASPAVLLVPGEPPQLNEAAREAGVTVGVLFADARDTLELGRAAPAADSYFAALNGAAWNTGATIRIPRGVTLAEPLRVVIPAQSATVVTRLLVVAEDGARATVVEDHAGGGPDSLVLGVTEVLVGANAEVRHVLVQRWQPGTRGHLIVRARTERDGRFYGATAGLGGQLVKTDVGCDLAGPGARSELVGFALAEAKQRFDHHTRHVHSSGRTWSNIEYKVAAAGKARSSYTGLIRIAADAPVSEAYQENRNLLLSPTAHADSIPELEILTDDVSCSHGATVAPVDDEQVFYLQSRGLPRTTALRLIVRGFLESTLVQVPSPLREELEGLVAERLARVEGAG
jgi:Fe-S cluster assembly protein SufD